jgi:uncharacterized membrane protein (UPF0127 family)
MQNNKTTLIFMAVAFVLFVIVKILPKYKAPPSHTTGKIQLDKNTKSDYSFQNEGSAWLIGTANETLSVLEIEIAATTYKIDKGLMYRKSMAVNQGMLFIFKEAGPQTFWMKNTYMSLDIIFVNDLGIVSHIHENALPKSLEPISSQTSVKYVLEVNSGFVAKNRVQLGSKLIFEKN